MKRKYLVSALIVLSIVGSAYATFMFGHAVPNGQYQATENVWLTSGYQYWVNVGGGAQCIAELKLKDNQGNFILIASSVLCDETALFTVATTGVYTCITTNVSTVPQQNVDASWFKP